jgi:hypothetical protein
MLIEVSMNWAEYAEASRRLSEVRRREADRRALVQERTAGGRAAVEPLKRRLTAQRDHLAALAVRVREPRPSFGGVARTGLADVDEAVREHSVRLGGLICFVGMWLTWFLFVAATRG